MEEEIKPEKAKLHFDHGEVVFERHRKLIGVYTPEELSAEIKQRNAEEFARVKELENQYNKRKALQEQEEKEKAERFTRFLNVKTNYGESDERLQELIDQESKNV